MPKERKGEWGVVSWLWLGRRKEGGRWGGGGEGGENGVVVGYGGVEGGLYDNEPKQRMR